MAAWPIARRSWRSAGREVAVSNPGKVYFPQTGHTKLDLVRYYLSVADGALRGVAGRPMVLKRFVNGAEGEAFFQKRAPDVAAGLDRDGRAAASRPGARAEEVVPRDAAALAWVVNLGCIDLNPHPVRADDLDHPDELRVDLDPVPGVDWPQIIRVALVAREVLADFGLTGWPKTSGSRGIHVYARIEPRWNFTEVRRAAVALAREIERRAPDLATAQWWKEERHGVFVDYNQNAKDRTVASAYSVRPTPDARVSAPLAWDEVPGLPSRGVHHRHRARSGSPRLGDPWAGIDDAAGSLEPLLDAGRAGRGGGPAGRAVAAALRQAGRRAAAGAAVQAPERGEPAPRRPWPRGAGTGRRPDRAAPVHHAAHRGGARGDQGRGAWPGWTAGRNGTRECWPHLEPADVLVDSMRGRSLHLDPDPAEPAARARPNFTGQQGAHPNACLPSADSLRPPSARFRLADSASFPQKVVLFAPFGLRLLQICAQNAHNLRHSKSDFPLFSSTS